MNHPNPQGIPIFVLETYPSVLAAFGDYAPGVQEWCIHCCKQAGLTLPPADWTLSERRVALAYVDHGRWIARCPCCTGGAMLVSKQDRTFWCTNCRNGCTDYQPIAVKFPP